MDANAVILLQELAKKLGTTSEYLWGVLLKQAPIYAATTLLEVSLFAFGVWFYLKNFKRFYAWFDDEVARGFGVVIASIAVALIALAAFFSLSGIVTALLNPEYFALNKLLSAIAKSK